MPARNTANALASARGQVPKHEVPLSVIQLFPIYPLFGYIDFIWKPAKIILSE
jgi:hypothetical protein